MSAVIATLGVVAACIYLLWLDRDKNKLSRGVWLPLIWLSIASSRPVSNWLTFAAPVSGGDSYIEGSPLDRNVLLLLLIGAVAVLAMRQRKLLPLLRRNLPLVLFIAYCGVSVLWADYPFVSFKRWIRAISDVAMIWIVLTEVYAQEAFQRVVTWMGVVLIPLSILFTRFFPSLGRSFSYSGVPMWTGVATDKNALGALCMIVGVVLLSRGITAFKAPRGAARSRRLFIVAVVLLLAIYLLFTIDSKTALACFLMASILILLPHFGPVFRQPVVVSLVMASMIGVAYAVLFLGMGSGTLASMGRDTTLTGRTEVWQVVLPFATNPLVGAGFENFWIGERLERIERELGAGLNQAHNGYIEIYLNIGWIGLLLLGLLLVAGYANIVKEFRRNPAMTSLRLGFFLICVVYNFTEAAFKIMSPVWIAFIWAITVIPRPRPAARKLSNRRRIGEISEAEESNSTYAFS